MNAAAQPRRIWLCADDYGISPGVNRAIRDLIVRTVDLEKLNEDLQIEIQTTQGQRRKKATKRLRVVENFRKSGNRPFLLFTSTNKVYGDRPNTIRLRELESRWDYDDPEFAGGIAESFPIDQSKHSIFGASKVAALPAVREALLFRQRVFRRAPGLVGDGRDMASVVFPDAPVKVFLTASAEVRAQRRTKQLMDKGLSASMEKILLDLRERDRRDSERSVAPLQQNGNAVLLDTSGLTIDQAVDAVLGWYGAASR